MRPFHPPPVPASFGAVRRAAALSLLAFAAVCSDTGTEPIAAALLAPGDSDVGPLLAATAAATTHTVYPTGEAAFDAAILQAAIDDADQGDILILKSTNTAGEPTPWILGRTTSEDFQVHTAQGSFWYFEDLRIPANEWFSNPLPPGVWYQEINVHKPLVIRGETFGGSPSTVVTVPEELQWVLHERTFTGVPGTFVINAMGVTIENISFEYLVEPLWAFSPGFDIKNNRFFRTAFQWLSPDVGLTYPQYPSYDAPVISYYRNNEILESLQGPHVDGSETEVTDNVLDLIRASYYDWVGIPVWGWASRPRDLSLPINWDLVQNNLIVHNTINLNHRGSGGVTVGNGAGGAVRNNTVRDNVIRDCGDGVGVRVVAASPYEEANGNHGTVVSGNTIENCTSPLVLLADGDTAMENRLTGNSVVHVTEPSHPSAGVYVSAVGGGAVNGNHIADNDFTGSRYPGWGEDAGAVFLTSGTNGNYVGNQKFPSGTTFCDQILDNGSNAVSGGGVCSHDPDHAQHVEEALRKKMNEG